MMRAIHKPRDMTFKRFLERLMEINNVLPLFPGSDTTKKMPQKNWMKYYFMRFPTGGQNSTTFKDGILIDDLQVNMRHVQTIGNRWKGVWRNITF